MESFIYMPLLGEGTDCWRPVRAVQVTGDVFEVVDQLPEGESWTFAPGSRVRCRNYIFRAGDPGLVAYEYAVASNPQYQLLKEHEQEEFRVVFANGEQAVIRVLHVDGAYEDFMYELLSTSFERDIGRQTRDGVYASRFDDLVSPQLVG